MCRLVCLETRLLPVKVNELFWCERGPLGRYTSNPSGYFGEAHRFTRCHGHGAHIYSAVVARRQIPVVVSERRYKDRENSYYYLSFRLGTKQASTPEARVVGVFEGNQRAGYSHSGTGSCRTRQGSGALASTRASTMNYNNINSRCIP